MVGYNTRDDAATPFWITCSKINGVEAATQIHYWEHFPVVDLEFETSAPVSVGLRALAPLIPGAAAASNIPAAVFEVHLRNTSSGLKQGTIAFSFPGPDTQEARAAEFTRRRVVEDFRSLPLVASTTSWASLGLSSPGSGPARTVTRPPGPRSPQSCRHLSGGSARG